MADSAQFREVIDALGSISTPVASEARLHELVAAALTAANIVHQHEVDLGAAGRIDFLTAGGVGIEVKVAGSRNEIARQVHGYAFVERVHALVLFTTRATHALATDTMNGKPLAVVRSKGWL